MPTSAASVSEGGHQAENGKFSNNGLVKNIFYKPASFLGIPMQIADEATLLTNKIVALTERKTAVASVALKALAHAAQA